MRSWALLVILFLIFVSALAQASDDCEARLGASFSTLIRLALDKNVISSAQVVALANSERPFNPIVSETPGSKNSSFIRAISAHLQMPPETWGEERHKLKVLAGTLHAREKTVADASAETAPILNPNLIESYPDWHSAWVEHDGHAYLAVVVDNHLQLRELGVKTPLWIDSDEFGKNGQIWFHKSNGRCSLIYYREVPTGFMDRIRYSGMELFEGLTLDVQSLVQTKHSLRLTDPDSLSTETPYLAYHRAEPQVRQTDMGTNARWVTLVTPEITQFETRCAGRIKEPKAFRKSDGEILLAIFCENNEVQVYSPFKSKDPIFSHVLQASRLTPKFGLLAKRLGFFEYDDSVYLAATVHGSTRIFDLRSTVELAEVDFKNFDGGQVDIVTGAKGRIYWVMRDITNTVAKTAVFAAFTPPEGANP